MTSLPLRTTVTEPRPRQRGPALKVRRYGRNDFEKFDEKTARGSHLRVGYGTIGEVEVDCKYHWSKAQWGTLGPNKHPAGIVYMDIAFKQPHGCRLERASVYITLGEDTASYALGAPHRRCQCSRETPGSLVSDYAVQIREYYGPYCITGPETTAEKTVNTSVQPSLGAAGLVKLGGMGRESSLSMEVSDRWVFKGTRGSPRGGDGIRTLEWQLTENQMGLNQARNQEFNTAFAFEHSQRPVFMRVEVEGELCSKRQKLKHKFATFSSNFGQGDNSTLTRMDFNRALAFGKSLDEVAQGLDMAMQYENCRKLAVEMPGATPAQFWKDEPLPADRQQQTALREREEPQKSEISDADPKEDTLLRGLRGQLDDPPKPATNRVEPKEQKQQEQQQQRQEQQEQVRQGRAFAGTVHDPGQQELLKVPVLVFIKLVVMIAEWFSRPIPRLMPPSPPAPSHWEGEEGSRENGGPGTPFPTQDAASRT